MIRWTTGCTVLATCTAVFAGEARMEGDTKTGNAALYPRVTMETTLGDITLELNAEKAPITVKNFIQYTEDKFYDGTIFHRVMKTFMAQGGGFTSDLEKKEDGLRAPIKLESDNGLSNARGTIAMARTGNPDSATAQFFINVVDNTRLDYRPGSEPNGYAVFGKVVAGMETVDKIRDTEVATSPKYGGGRNPVVPVEPVVIKSVRTGGDFDRAKFDEAVTAAEAGKAAETEKAAIAEKDAKKEEMAGFATKLENATANGTKTDSGLIVYDTLVGDGPSPQEGEIVKVHYTGWLTDGSKFDSSLDRNQPFSFPLGQGRVIKGWDEGVATMKVGGKRTLIIPSELAYGSRERSKIPANSTLVFDIEFLAIN